MITPPNLRRDTVSHLDKIGYDFYVKIPVLKEQNTTTDHVVAKISAIQLSKAVLSANRKDEIIVDCKSGRNGSKSAFIVEIPYF